jgi:hypothetical protein
MIYFSIGCISSRLSSSLRAFGGSGSPWLTSLSCFRLSISMRIYLNSLRSRWNLFLASLCFKRVSWLHFRLLSHDFFLL